MTWLTIVCVVLALNAGFACGMWWAERRARLEYEALHERGWEDAPTLH
jgi:uncharacterized protein YneF (UPF0154 family)